MGASLKETPQPMGTDSRGIGCFRGIEGQECDTERPAGVLTSIEHDQLESLVGLVSSALECLEARTVGASRL